jgi:hypothetical protein
MGSPFLSPAPSNCVEARKAQFFFSVFRSVREATPRTENQLLLTKGDNNYLDDVELYQGLDWLEHKHIIGKVRGCVIAVAKHSHTYLLMLFY